MGEPKQKTLEKVKSHRQWIQHWVAEGVPCYDSITLATESLANY